MISAPVGLRPDHDTRDFHSGREPLDRWLAERALSAQRGRTAVTYVVTESGRVIGYYSLAGHSIRRDNVGGGRLARNAPDRISAVLLTRLAVDTGWQGRGIGWSLLAHGIGQARAAGSPIGVRALVVDAIDDEAASFYQHFGLRPFPAARLRLFTPLN